MTDKLPDFAGLEQPSRSIAELMATDSSVPFNNLTQLATQIAQTPVGFISLMNPTHQWLKSQVGLSKNSHHYLDFCHVVLSGSCVQTADNSNPFPSASDVVLPDFILIEDTTTDPQLSAHPLVRGDGIRFYLGLPIHTPGGLLVGLLSVMDNLPRHISDQTISALQTLARQIASQLDLNRQLINSRSKVLRLEEMIKQRQQVWEIVRQERDFVQNVLDPINALVIVFDAQGKIIRFNPICEHLTGYTAQAVEGKTLQELGLSILAQLQQQQALLSDQTGLNSSFPKQSESEWRTENGSRHLIAWSNTTLLNPDGSLKQVIATGIDITEHRRSEEMLRLLERAITASPNGVLIVDASRSDYPIIYCNPTFERITGYSPQEMVGSHFECLHGSQTDPAVLEQIYTCLGQAQKCKVTLKLYRKDGTAFWDEIAISPVRDPQNNVTHFIWIHVDITERQQSEAALRASEARYRILADYATDLISRHTRDGVFIYASPACRGLLGYQPEELIGRCAYDLFHPEDIEEVKRSHAALMAGEACEAISYRIRCKNGKYIWFETTAHAVENSQTPQVQELVAVSRDITTRKQTEAAILEQSHLSLLEAEVGAALGQGGSVDAILQQCSFAIANHLKITSVAIWILNLQTYQLELQASAGTQPVPLKLDHAGENPSPILYFPLVVEGRAIGRMGLTSPLPMTQPVQNALHWITNAIAVGIDRIRAREELYSRREGLLFKLASQIRDSRDLNSIIAKAVSEIRTLLHVDQCHFLWNLLTPEHQPRFVVTHQDQPCESNYPQHYPPDQIGWLAEKIERHEILQVEDVVHSQILDLQTRQLLQGAGVTSILFLPLKTHSGQQGAIVCQHYDGECRQWNPREVELLRAVVDQLAVAIDQAELYAQTRAAALAAQTQAAQLSQAFEELKHKEAQLIQSEKMSSLGQMVAGIAHEINNPVNFIYGNLDYVRDYTQNILEIINLYQQYYPQPASEIEEMIEEVDLEFIMEDLPKILASMGMGAERICQIVVSLRNFSRLDEAEMKPVDIHDGIDSTLLILRNRWKSKKADSGVEIIKQYGQLPPVECYAGQLNQVFMNIIGNAIDAIEHQTEPRIITINTELLDSRDHPNLSNSPFVRIKIKDNGPGVTEAVKNRLFDPFFTTKPVGKGTGLGLSISYKIVVEKHGGVLRCISQPGQGCEFWIEIPVEPPPQLRVLD